MTYNINKFSNIKFKFNTNDSERIRLPNVNPNKIFEKNFKLVVFNNEEIIINNEKIKYELFLKEIYDNKIKYICLSKFQRTLSSFKVKDIFSYFPYIEYEEHQEKNLESQYDILNSMFIELSTQSGFEKKYNSVQDQWNVLLKFKQSRKLRFKSLLDNNFFFSVKPGYSDVFKLLENRPNRSIYQLDVNSMYPYAMTMDNFSEPKSLKYKSNNNIDDILNGKIDNGVFNCSMIMKRNLSKNKINFIKYLPLNIIENNTSIPINIKYKDEINILLHANEIKFYSRFFDIKVEDGVYSKESISHPLKNWVKETYNKRLQSSGDQKSFYKFILVLSHSISMSYYDKHEKMDFETARLTLEEDYQYIINDKKIDNKYFSINDFSSKAIKMKSYDLKNSNNVYSMYSQTLANARVHLLELYESIHSINGSYELCYCNIDSLHISVPNNALKAFKSQLDKISSPTIMGKLKIESIGSMGVWFEPGRYWIYDKKEELISFKNTIFNDNNSDHKCTFKRVSYFKDNKYMTNYFSLFKTLQHKKRINKKEFNNIVYEKNNENLSLTNNIINNIKTYKDIFYKYIK